MLDTVIEVCKYWVIKSENTKSKFQSTALWTICHYAEVMSALKKFRCKYSL